MKREKGMLSDRAVSETIGFIIIFGIVMTGIGIVTLYGYPALMQEQENANIKNMEKNMLVLQSDLRTLTYKNVPYQETAIQVSGGTLSIKDEPGSIPHFTIDIDGAETDYTLGELNYISGNGMTNIALENGAVHIRYWSDPTGSAMLAEPSWFYDSVTKSYVIQFIRLNATSHFGQTGIGTVRMQIIDPPQAEAPINISEKQVKISYTANPDEDYMIAWRNYFNNPQLGMINVDSSSWPTVTAELNPSAQWLIIKKYNVTVLSI